MQKQTVFLPYDFDTACGINNEGSLEFSYNLEDIDTIGGDKEVYNGQKSALWVNTRKAFFNEIKEMYQTLRASGKLSYAVVEKMFEDHQSKWPIALVNEDARFTYVNPLTNPDPNWVVVDDETGELVPANPTAAYLTMLQGLKTEQRKWWLSNRFAYLDSKYNAGDALTNVITLRGYAKADITLTPYADIYTSVKYGSYLVQKRATRNNAYTLECPIDNVNDTEIYIYSCDKLASIGDLSGLMIGYADFSLATKLQTLKIGDSSISYSNPNCLDLYLGGNVLLKVIDARNLTNLGGSRNIGGETINSRTPTIDLTGCVDLEEVYFEGTSIKALSFSTGGMLKIIHLPATITNLTIIDQKYITDLTCPDYSNITTLRIENCSSTVNPLTILDDIQANSRVRIVGFNIEANAVSDIEEFYDELDTMRGLDEFGNTVNTAQVAGTIHISAIDGDDLAALEARYPYIYVDADHITADLTYKTYDGSSTIDTEEVHDGGNGTKTNSTARTADAQYSYTPNGWSLVANGDPDPNALVGVRADRTVYAAYTKTIQKYTVLWKNSNGTTLETDNNVPYGTTPTYNGATPVDPSGNNSPFVTWTPTVGPITGATTYTASYKPVWTVTFKSQDGSTTLQTKTVIDGNNATYTGTTPTNADSTTFLGWAASANASAADSTILNNIKANKTVYAAFESRYESVEITDDWATIIANIDNGTYTKYKLGNYKPLDLGTEGTVNMEIVSKGGDVDKNNASIALTFISKELLSTSHNMNSTNTTEGGWPATSMKSYLDSTIMGKIPAAVKGNIIAAKKTYSDYISDSKVVSFGYDKLWIPSNREIFNNNDYENSGVTYVGAHLYKDATSRIKKKVGSSSGTIWWLRSAGSSASFRSVYSSGNAGNSGASYAIGVALGFCLGSSAQAHTISDSWEDIISAASSGAYASKYAIGDYKPLDLGTEGVVNMEIVAFNADDKADGTGKAPITFVAKELLSTSHNMNSTNTAEGGWENSEMRSYLSTTIWNKIPSTVRDAIKPVTKKHDSYTGSTKVSQTTTDSVWVPSNREVGLTDETNYSNVYSSKFTNATSRIKKKVGSSSGASWWLRSAASSTNFRYVTTGGYAYYSNAGGTDGVALGFCL